MVMCSLGHPEFRMEYDPMNSLVARAAGHGVLVGNEEVTDIGVLDPAMDAAVSRRGGAQVPQGATVFHSPRICQVGRERAVSS